MMDTQKEVEKLQKEVLKVKQHLAHLGTAKLELNEQLRTLNSKINILTNNIASKISKTSIQGHAPTVTTS